MDNPTYNPLNAKNALNGFLASTSITYNPFFITQTYAIFSKRLNDNRMKNPLGRYNYKTGGKILSGVCGQIEISNAQEPSAVSSH